MTIAMTKSKGKLKSAVKKEPKDELMQKVDRLAEIKASLDAVAPLVKEKAEIESFFKDFAAASAPPEQPVSFAGEKYVYVLDAARMKRTVKDNAVLAKLLGYDVFLQVAKVSMEDIDKYLTDAQKAEALEESRTGPRIGKLVPRQ